MIDISKAHLVQIACHKCVCSEELRQDLKNVTVTCHAHGA